MDYILNTSTYSTSSLKTKHVPYQVRNIFQVFIGDDFFHKKLIYYVRDVEIFDNVLLMMLQTDPVLVIHGVSVICNKKLPINNNIQLANTCWQSPLSHLLVKRELVS